MKILLLGSFPFLEIKLKEQDISFCTHRGADVHSLTALMLHDPDCCFLVLDARGNLNWSDGHILAAAKLLQSKGSLILVGNGPSVAGLSGSRLVSPANSEEDAWRIISQPRPTASGAKKDSGGAGQVRRLKPLALPAATILLIDVVGTQPRIGCTTQAIALWHYFHALGLDPAVVMSEAQIRELTSTMQVQQKFPGGCVIDGICFVTDTQRANDCYIRDCGCAQISHTDADAVILVAGVKPWELAYTMQGIRTLKHRNRLAVLSFADPGEAKKLELLFTNGDIPAAAAEYIPNPWLIPAAALLLFDKLLHPILTRHLKEETKWHGIDPQKT